MLTYNSYVHYTLIQGTYSYTGTITDTLYTIHGTYSYTEL